MNQVYLPYSRSSIEIQLPGGQAPDRARCVFPEPLQDVPLSVKKAFCDPSGGEPLSSALPDSGRITVLVSDLTRGRTAASVLIAVLRYLESLGAGPDRTSVLIAGGMHRGQSPEEIEKQLGPDVAKRYSIGQHDASDRSSLVDSGVTSFGTRCLFNREAAESALIIGVGAVSFHYFAGYGGGRKIILPGISGEETILANHRLSLREDPGEGPAAGCAPGRLEGNPVHEDMVEGAALFPAPLMMVCAVAGAGGVPSFVCAGSVGQSHLDAVEKLRAGFTLPLDRRYPAVIASAGGFPGDINLLQAHKAIRHASMAVRDGGILLVAASCSEGIGSASLEDAFARGREGVIAAVRERYTLNSQAAMSICRMTGRADIRFHSSIPEETLRMFGFGAWRPEDTASILEGIPAGDILVIGDSASFLPVAE